MSIGHDEEPNGTSKDASVPVETKRCQWTRYACLDLHFTRILTGPGHSNKFQRLVLADPHFSNISFQLLFLVIVRLAVYAPIVFMYLLGV